VDYIVKVVNLLRGQSELELQLMRGDGAAVATEHALEETRQAQPPARQVGSGYQRADRRTLITCKFSRHRRALPNMRAVKTRVQSAQIAAMRSIASLMSCPCSC
jgi:hypothetical protein